MKLVLCYKLYILTVLSILYLLIYVFWIYRTTQRTIKRVNNTSRKLQRHLDRISKIIKQHGDKSIQE